MKKMFTVILVYPDYVGSDFPEFFQAYVEARTASKAIAAAREKALDHCELSANEEDDNYCDPSDFGCVAVFAGWQDDLNPE